MTLYIYYKGYGPLIVIYGAPFLISLYYLSLIEGSSLLPEIPIGTGSSLVPKVGHANVERSVPRVLPPPKVGREYISFSSSIFSLSKWNLL
jgi:hypothetical protein